MADMRAMHRCRACGAQVSWTNEVGAVLKCQSCGSTEFTYVGKALVANKDATAAPPAAAPITCPQCGHAADESQGAEVVDGKTVLNYRCDECGKAFTHIPLPLGW